MRKTKKRYAHLSLEDRVEIYRMHTQGISMQDIAKTTNRNVSSISRELKRNRTPQYKQYTPVKADEISHIRARRQRIHAPLKNPEVFVYVRKKLKEGWSPEMISGRITIDLPHQSISHEAIYQYIFGKGKRQKLWKHLKVRNKRQRKKQDGRTAQKKMRHSRIPDAVSIELRSTKANKRTQVGHFETDLMEGNKSDRAVISVDVERKTRYTQLSLLPSKHARIKEEMLTKKLKAIQSLHMSNKPIVRSITADNGSENTRHRQLSHNLGVDVFFAHPYASWEKGSVENMIGRMRYYIPKGTPLSQYTDSQIQWLENTLNNTPRKCLGWMTPNEALEREVNSYKFRRFKKEKESLECCTST